MCNVQHRADLVGLLFLNPELSAYSNVRTVEAAAAAGYASSGLPSSVPPLPVGFDARVFLAAQPDVSGLNRAIRDALIGEGASVAALRRRGEMIGTLRERVALIAPNTFELPIDSFASFSACNLQVDDDVRLFRALGPGAEAVDARVVSMAGLRGFVVQPLDSPYPLVDADATYVLHGIRIWDPERQARVGYVRSLPIGNGSNDPDQVPAPGFEDDVYRTLFPDARGFSEPDAYLDYRARWRREEYRVGAGGDIFNVRAPYNSNGVGAGGTGGGGGGGSATTGTFSGGDLFAGWSNLVVRSNAASLRSGITMAASNLVLTPNDLMVGGDRLVVNGGDGSVSLAAGSVVADAAGARVGCNLTVGGGLGIGCNLMVGGGLGIGMADPPGTHGCDTRLAVAGDVFVTGTVVSLSDARAKARVEPIDHPLERVARLRGVTFEHRDGKDADRRHTGLLAQDVAEALPEAIYEQRVPGSRAHAATPQSLNSVAYGNLAGLFAEAINALNAKMKLLEAGGERLALPPPASGVA